VPAGATQLSAGAMGHSMASGHGPVAAGQIGNRHISAGQLSPAQKLTVPGRMPISANLTVDEPAFDRVTRTAREITNMVPV